ncbi:NAD(P)-dependent oxidoreductase [Sedimenticola sp.]|uniref:NAD(P)-dependent oxidoreductase n=1 Tax=Sedimenticola sp. TaxID=1940285 RepID=UPI0025894423|nr:NAD(P)-dependent oxidoreductase [Sedimenticola sp.]MCW8905153.1 NAD(P)-dependent oxidoreductase [Sedimenticola sp.]
MNRLKDHTLGFIGLGLMGRPMCLNLHKAGAHLIVHNRSPEAARQLERPGIVPVASPAEVARSADIILLMVADTPAVEQVLLGKSGLIECLQANALVIDMGTTAVAPTREFARRLNTIGVDYIDAPVSGGEIGAINGNLTIMAGGTEESIQRALPLFEVLGSKFTHVGDVGAGQIAKAANQVIVGLNIGAVAEALALAKRAGADPAKVREALMGGFAGSRILEVHGQRMIEENFKPGGKIATQYKDLVQALELAALFGLDLPATKLNMQLYKSLIDQGQGNLDHSALIKALNNQIE